MKKLKLILLLICISTLSFGQTTINNTFTGSPQVFLVPDCVYSLTITSAGGEGGGNLGGNGAVITSTLTVNPGDVLNINVGGAGTCPNSGYNGGGSGFASTDGNATYNSCGGGGMTTVFYNGVLYSIAAGGGGTGGGSTEVLGGIGGCIGGGNGGNTYGGGGSGGTQSAGGNGGTPWAGTPPGGSNGSLNQGGNGGLWQTASGGGGGAGYYGGGGGGNDGCCTGANGGGGGGGGSSFIPFGAGCTQGVNTGNGYVTISYIAVDLDTTINANVCTGSNYIFPDGTSAIINAPTTQISNILSVNGCDSVVTTNLFLDPSFNTIENYELCAGGDFVFPDGTILTNINSNTSHINFLQTINGCDSIITTQLQINPTYNVNQVFNLCEGSDYVFPDGTSQTNITSNVLHVSNLTTVNGCDSIINTQINVIPTINVVVNDVICSGLSYTFPDGTVIDNITSLTSHTSNFTTVDGCDSNVVTNVNVHPQQTLDINPSVTSGCAPLYVELNTSILGLSYIWEVSNGENNHLFTDDTVAYLFENSGEYYVFLQVTDLNGCILEQNFNNVFTVYDQPVSSFGWGPISGNIIDNHITFNNLSSNAYSYVWDFGDGNYSNIPNPSNDYQDTGVYVVTLIVYNEIGCSDTSYNSILIKDVVKIFVPNVFTPDNDEYNQVFFPYVTNVLEYHLTIYNRWGMIMFESYDQNVGWDGTYSDRGIVADGVYVWVIEVTDINYVKQTLRGHVTVLK